MNQINTLEDVMNIAKPEVTPDFTRYAEKEKGYEEAKWQWEQIVKAYNFQRDPNWKADLADWDQRKNFPWVELVKDETQLSGFRFTYSSYYYSGTNAYLGVRLLFADPNDVLDALKKFGQIYIISITQ